MEWSSCSRTCGSGEVTRTRSCTQPRPQYRGKQCVGNPIESQLCLIKYCPSKKLVMNSGSSEACLHNVVGEILKYLTPFLLPKTRQYRSFISLVLFKPQPFYASRAFNLSVNCFDRMLRKRKHVALLIPDGIGRFY